VHAPVLAIPVDGTQYAAGAQVVESVAFVWVTLSQVVTERPEVLRVTGDEGL
jgi:hypothetical protein